jgi:hypothetical protein
VRHEQQVQNTAPQEPPPKPVAVIAVHGVGYCERFATARHVASLLLGLGRLRLEPIQPQGPYRVWSKNDEDNPPYHGCGEQMIQVPLKPADVKSRQDATRRRFDESSLFGRLLHFFDERRGYIADVFAKRVTPDLHDRGKWAHEFMRGQLAEYLCTPDGQAYETIRLETERVTPASSKTVHVYEHYWADLARPQNSIISFFNALYQLLFHLGSLSRTAVDYAAAEHWPHLAWRLMAFWQNLAVRLFVLPIPILNLILLLAGLTVLPLRIQLDQGMLASALVGLFALVLRLLWPKRVPGHLVSWIAQLAFFSALGFMVGALALKVAGYESRKLAANIAIAIEWWVLGGYFIGRWMKRYEEVRRGAFRTFLVLYVLALAAFLWLLFGKAFSSVNPVEQASFWTIQVIMAALITCWVALLSSGVVSWVQHAICLLQLRRRCRRTRKPIAVYARACAALRTARLTLAASASLFLLITVFLWAGAFAYTNRKLSLYKDITLSYPDLPAAVTFPIKLFVPSSEDAFRWIHERETQAAHSNSEPAQCQQIPSSGLLADGLEQQLNDVRPAFLRRGLVLPPLSYPYSLEEDVSQLESKVNIKPERSLRGAPLDCETRVYRLQVNAGLTTESEFSIYARALLLASTTSGVPLMLAFLALLVILLVCAIARSVLCSQVELNRATNRESARLGEWLSRGLDSTRVVTWLSWHCIFSVAFIFGVIDYFYARGMLSSGPSLWFTSWLLKFARFWSCHSLALLDLVGARLALSGAAIGAIIYRYGHVPLDILLDVDSYLRTSPLNNAPRARIAERYVSLLRYIADQSNQDGTPFYGSVVIVAHSLGALISADLLHFLNREKDPQLARFGYSDAQNPIIPLHLFTFGNPHRQLLNRFFPHLYWWVREEPDNGTTPLANASATLPRIGPQSNNDHPHLTDLGPGVRTWVNAYRSGDFVGRFLWAQNWFCRNERGPNAGPYPEPIAVTTADDTGNGAHMREEMCIGTGAHNDYWNRTAPDIAEKLDQLVMR